MGGFVDGDGSVGPPEDFELFGQVGGSLLANSVAAKAVTPLFLLFPCRFVGPFLLGRGDFGLVGVDIQDLLPHGDGLIALAVVEFEVVLVLGDARPADFVHRREIFRSELEGRFVLRDGVVISAGLGEGVAVAFSMQRDVLLLDDRFQDFDGFRTFVLWRSGWCRD